MAGLPPRSAEAEDAFVASWLESSDTDGLVEAINLAMDDRRPMLAARLVQLLDDHVEIPEGSDLERASRAARMFLLDSNDAQPKNWSALEEAWDAARRQHHRRVKKRMRRGVDGQGTSYGRRYGRDSKKRR